MYAIKTFLICFPLRPEFEDRKRNEKFDNSTLFDLTAQSIFANQNHFLGVFELTGINPFDQICMLTIKLRLMTFIMT